MEIKTVDIKNLKFSEYNPRTLTEKEFKDLKKSLKEFGFVEPIVVNSAPNRNNVVIGGHQRIKVARDMGTKQIPVHYVKISDINREQELNLRLNKNLGHWDYDLLANFDENLLENVGFEREELDDIFGLEFDEEYDVEKELEKILKGRPKRIKDGDLWQLGEHKLVIGNCVDRKNWEQLLGNEKFNFMFTDPPYRIGYGIGIRKQKTKEGFKLQRVREYPSIGKTTKEGKVFDLAKSPLKPTFGYKRNRIYLGTQKSERGVPEYDEWFSIANDFQNATGTNVMIFESWKNTIKLWQAMEKYWKIRNMVIWYLPNRCQGFAQKNHFFNKYDIAPLADKGKAIINQEYEQELEKYLEEKGQKLLESYEVIIFGGQRDNYYEQGKKGGKWVKATDHITGPTQTGKSSGQGLIFGTKPVRILVPYIKILSPRNGIVQDPFAGSGSTIIACEIMKRKCRAIEIEPIYGEVILARWERFTGGTAERIAQMAQVSQEK